MTDFEQYLQELANHEEKKAQQTMSAREKILLYAGFQLNWMGDLLSNPKIKYKQITVPLEEILFTGTNPEWNKILIDKCEKSVTKFQKLLEENPEMKEKFSQEASFGDESILIIKQEGEKKYKVFDGMHRFVGAAIKHRKTISAYTPESSINELPICEAHTIYDLIRGYQRNAQDEQGKKELYHALKLLSRTYKNVVKLLETRFDESHLPDEEVQKIIKKIINNQNYE